MPLAFLWLIIASRRTWGSTLLLMQIKKIINKWCRAASWSGAVLGGRNKSNAVFHKGNTKLRKLVTRCWLRLSHLGELEIYCQVLTLDEGKSFEVILVALLSLVWNNIRPSKNNQNWGKVTEGSWACQTGHITVHK